MTFLQFPDCDCFIFPNEAFIGEAEIAVIADNDVIKAADAGCLGCHHEAFGESPISIARGYRVGRVIVDHDDRGSVVANCHLNNIADVGIGLIHSAEKPTTSEDDVTGPSAITWISELHKSFELNSQRGVGTSVKK